MDIVNALHIINNNELISKYYLVTYLRKTYFFNVFLKD